MPDKLVRASLVEVGMRIRLARCTAASRRIGWRSRPRWPGDAGRAEGGDRVAGAVTYVSLAEPGAWLLDQLLADAP